MYRADLGPVSVSREKWVEQVVHMGPLLVEGGERRSGMFD